MDTKCSKFKSLFIASDEQALKQHILECDECRHEYEKMNKVSDLLGEVKTHYTNHFKRKRKLVAICAAFFLVVFTSTFFYVSNDEDLSNTLMYGDSLTAEQLGFPVDSDGLLMVD